MPDTGIAPEHKAEPQQTLSAPARAAPVGGLRAVPLLVTALSLMVAGVLAWAAWQAYMAAPWTRDGAVRAYVVNVAPEVAGRVVQLAVHDNQSVQKGELLFEIDPTDYAIAVQQAQAAADQARATARNADLQAQRRARLSNLETSLEEQESYLSKAQADEAAYQAAIANLAKARLNLQRARVVSPVNGYVTNLQLQPGDYVTPGQQAISVVDQDSFWVDGYFQETSLDQIKVGDPATIRLMGARAVLHGRVAGIARGIVGANAANGSGLASINPVFAWVRLAQRVPVRIAITQVPAGVQLVAGETASIAVQPQPR